MIAVLIRRQHHLGQSISVEIADGDATTIVKIAVGEDVELRRIFDAIHEAHPGVARGEQREKVTVYGRSRGRAGEFLLLLVTGARGEIQRGKEIRTK